MEDILFSSSFYLRTSKRSVAFISSRAHHVPRGLEVSASQVLLAQGHDGHEIIMS